jgi:hypothetical protein
MSGSPESQMSESAQSAKAQGSTKRKLLTQERVRELFDYIDGHLVWQISRGGVNVGDIAGSVSHGYVQVKINNVNYRAHRLIWLWHYGYLPENDIDHLNRIRADNRIENLREVGDVCNQRNTTNHSTNTSGVKGVCWNAEAGKWHANIMVNGKQYYLGYHLDFFEAVCHRLAGEQALDWSGCDDCSPALQHIRKEITHVR